VTTNRIVGWLAAALIVAACGASPPTPHVIGFAAAMDGTVAALGADGYSCEENPAASSGPAARPAIAAIRVANCRKAAPGAQGTFVTVYGLRADGTVAGIDVMTDQGGDDPARSPALLANVGRAFPAGDAVDVEAAIRTLASRGGGNATVSDRVRVNVELAPLLFVTRIWGPEVVAFSDALVNGGGAPSGPP
jgi:hypothetical protein